MQKLLLVFLSVISVAANAAEVESFRADARVEIDASGKPTKIEASRDLPGQVRTFIERQISTWHFTPPSRDGVSGAGVTYLTLGACAVPEGDGYRMAIDFKGNGPRLVGYAKLPTPRYPVEAIRARREADLVVYWTVETDGHVSLDRIERKNGSAPRKTDPFYAAIAEWLKQLRYEPELLAGKPVRTRMSVSVPFTFAPRRSNPEVERQEQLDKTGQSPECQIAAANSQEEIQAVAIDSPFNLQAL